MNVLRWLTYCSVAFGIVAIAGVSQAAEVKQDSPLCPEPALSRVVRHRVAPGETLVSISQRYDLLPATLMGMNPVLRNNSAPVGTEILVPPFNGIRVEVPRGRTWRDIAATYRVRADVLFEVNGCQSAPRVVFVPGVNWSPSPAPSGTAGQPNRVLRGYPLPNIVPVIAAYGWRVDPASNEVVFSSGVDLAAAADTPVLSVGEGVVAFAANQGNYGNLVVINHSDGLQTRYAHLATVGVRVGQKVGPGDRIGTVGNTGLPNNPQLHFEVRSNSDLGWVARDPATYLQNMRAGD